MECGVAQGSSLGSLLFAFYVAPLSRRNHQNFISMLYADKRQILFLETLTTRMMM